MAAPGVKPNPDRSQVVHHERVHEFTEVEDVPFEGGPELPPRSGSSDPVSWASAGVIPGEDWPQATLWWWDVIKSMPHAKLWTPGDWAFAAATAECHARFAEGWKGYTGGELRQREKLMGVYLDARRDLRIKYVPAKPGATTTGDHDTTLPPGVANINDYRNL